MSADQPPIPMKNETPITKLPDGSGCFTATILSRDEAMALPLRDRPLNYRISSAIYHAVFEAVGAASLCWNPKPGDEVFDSEAASKIATDLCFKIAEDIEKTFPDQPPAPAPAPTPNVSETPITDGKVLIWNLSERELRERQPHQLGYNGTSINGKVVLADFARQLERELTAVTKERDLLKEQIKALNPGSTSTGYIFNKMREAFLVLGGKECELDFRPYKLVGLAKAALARAEKAEEALRDVESKIIDFTAGKINWRPDDFLYRVRAALTPTKEPAQPEKNHEHR